jgi:hypothetical protein
MSNLPGSHYTKEQELEIFDNWSNTLATENPDLATEIVKRIVEKQFPEESVDKI